MVEMIMSHGPHVRLSVGYVSGAAACEWRCGTAVGRAALIMRVRAGIKCIE